MDLMEYKAKELFALAGLPVASGFTIDSLDELKGLLPQAEYPCMVKAQVQVGGRGKLGGIRSATNADELETVCSQIMGMDIKGHTVRKLLITRRTEIVREWYLSITLDRMEKCPLIIFSSMGGMDIEQVAQSEPDKIVRVSIDPVVGVKSYAAAYIVSKSGIDPKYTAELNDILQKLYKMFREYDCTLCEINPLAVTDNDRLELLDAKISIDDSALYRYPDLLALRDEWELDPQVLKARQFKFLYIPCDSQGSIAVMSNGSGMLMSCIDLISKNGMSCRAALDMGGGATADRIKEGIAILLSEEETNALFLNIFGGITRCDEVANGVKQFMEEYGSDKVIIIRFEGTNKEKGVEILGSIGRDNVVFADGLYQGIEALCERRGDL